MIKSLKGQIILSYVTSSLFIIYILMLFNTPIQISNTQINIYIIVTLAAVFNAGIQTQRYFQTRKSH